MVRLGMFFLLAYPGSAGSWVHRAPGWWAATRKRRRYPDSGENRVPGRSHRRADDPWREFGGPEVELLALGPLAGGDAQHQLENPLPGLLHGFVAIEDGAAVHVHVVLDVLVHRRIGRKLDRGRRFAAEDAAAAGGEAHQVRAAGDL